MFLIKCLTMTLNEEQAAQFWAKVNKTDTCWLWTACVGTDGYGRFNTRTSDGHKVRIAHRISLALHLERDIAPGMDVCHTPLICHNRLCVNPAHLREDTRAGNLADCVVDRTRPRGTTHGLSKLTEDQVLAIRADTRPQSKIAESYGVSQTLISKIKRRIYWSWLA